jgi:hypothetical protein
MFLTTYNKVVSFNKHNGEEAFRGNQGQVRKTKKEYEGKVSAYMEAHGHALFKSKQAIVFDELVFQTSVTGIQTISMATIEKRTGASTATISRVISKIKKLGLFIVGYLRDGHKGKYVLVFRLHKNYQRIMQYVFGVESASNPVEDVIDNAGLIVEEKVNDKSIDNSSDKSSNHEIPCGSKAEEGKKVSTLYSPNTLKETYKKDGHKSHLIDVIKSRKKVLACYQEKAEELVSVLPTPFNALHRDAFERILANQMTRVTPKYDVVGYFSTMFNNEVQILEHSNAVDEHLVKQGNFTFFDWVNPKNNHNQAEQQEIMTTFSFHDFVKIDDVLENLNQETHEEPFSFFNISAPLNFSS